MYVLRDVIVIVDLMFLIVFFIMSKKLVLGVDVIVFDVKVGFGVFMKILEDGEVLFCIMVDIGKKVGKKVIVIFIGMEEFLGYKIGNVLEIYELVEIFEGYGLEDLI